MDIDIEAILALPVDDKFRLMELIWDSLPAEVQGIQLSPSDMEEVMRRQREMEADPSIGISHEEMMRRLDDMCQ